MRRTVRAADGLRAEEGFTIVELLIASAMGLVVIGAAVTVFTASIHSQPRLAERGSEIQEARFTMEQITREIRQGWDAPVATASQLSVLTYVRSATCGGESAGTAIACLVTYSCTTGSCTRVESQPNGTGPGPARSVISGLSSSDVFSYYPSSAAPSEVGVTLAFPAEGGDDAITLGDTVSFRNPGVP